MEDRPTLFSSPLVFWKGIGAALIATLSLVACAPESPPRESRVGAGGAERGERIYIAQCTSCHNRNPAKEGALGPAVEGASPELLEARLLHASYPPGHQPKRQTSVMPVLPHLAANIPDLAAFLRISTEPGSAKID